jgi:hypothetical protein
MSAVRRNNYNIFSLFLIYSVSVHCSISTSLDLCKMPLDEKNGGLQ